MELIHAYWYMHPGEFQALINIQKKKQGALDGWWVTQDGVKLKAYMMYDSHLINCIKMVEKKTNFPLRKYAMHHVMNRTSTLPPAERKLVTKVRKNVIYVNMVHEAYKRGLIYDV